MIRQIFFLLICAIGFVGGLWLLDQGAKCALRAWESADWPTVTGRVDASNVVRHTSHGRHGSSTSYTPSVRYSYDVAGRSYTASEIMPGRNWGSKSSYHTVAAHPVASMPAIHYYPADPSIAVLEAGLHPENFGQVLIGLVLLTMASLFGLIARNAVDGPPGSRQMSMRPGAAGNRLILPLLGLLVLEIVSLVWLS